MVQIPKGSLFPLSAVLNFFYILMGWVFGGISGSQLSQSCGESGAGQFGVLKSFFPKCVPVPLYLGIFLLGLYAYVSTNTLQGLVKWLWVCFF